MTPLEPEEQDPPEGIPADTAGESDPASLPAEEPGEEPAEEPGEPSE